MTDKAVARMLRHRPLESGILHKFASDLRDSSWFQAAPETTWHLVGEHLETFDDLLRQWQRVAGFQLDVLREYLPPYKDELPAEAQAVIEALDVQASAQDKLNRFFLQIDQEQVLPLVPESPEALELLEEAPSVKIANQGG